MDQIYVDMYGPDDSDPTVWVCADGREVRVQDMSDAHLLNVKRLLERNNTNRILRVRYAMHEIDDAQWAEEDDMEDFFDPIEEIFPVYATIVAEIHMREERAQSEVVLFCNNPAGGYTTLLV